MTADRILLVFVAVASACAAGWHWWTLALLAVVLLFPRLFAAYIAGRERSPYYNPERMDAEENLPGQSESPRTNGDAH